VRHNGGRRGGGRRGSWWRKKMRRRVRKKAEARSGWGRGSGWVGGIKREEERNESDMMLLALCDITEAKKNAEYINSYTIWCMIR
jgi:hypothetical protein